MNKAITVIKYVLNILFYINIVGLLTTAFMLIWSGGTHDQLLINIISTLCLTLGLFTAALVAIE